MAVKAPAGLWSGEGGERKGSSDRARVNPQGSRRAPEGGALAKQDLRLGHVDDVPAGAAEPPALGLRPPKSGHDAIPDEVSKDHEVDAQGVQFLAKMTKVVGRSTRRSPTPP